MSIDPDVSGVAGGPVAPDPVGAVLDGSMVPRPGAPGNMVPMPAIVLAGVVDEPVVGTDELVVVVDGIVERLRAAGSLPD